MIINCCTDGVDLLDGGDQDGVDLDSQVLLKLRTEVSNDLRVEGLVDVVLVVLNCFIRRFEMPRVSQEMDGVFESMAEVSDSLEPLELREDVEEHRWDD